MGRLITSVAPTPPRREAAIAIGPTIFDAREAFAFKVDEDEAVEGFDRGVSGMKAGEPADFTVPAGQAFRADRAVRGWRATPLAAAGCPGPSPLGPRRPGRSRRGGAGRGGEEPGRSSSPPPRPATSARPERGSIFFL